jgi:hypothetical protein
VDSAGILEYNASSTPRVVSFSGSSKKDVFGKVYDNSVTIPAWSSKLLLPASVRSQAALNASACGLPSPVANGLDYRYYEGAWLKLPYFPSSILKKPVPFQFRPDPANATEQFGFRFAGFIQVPSDGMYTFYTIRMMEASYD